MVRWSRSPRKKSPLDQRVWWSSGSQAKVLSDLGYEEEEDQDCKKKMAAVDITEGSGPEASETSYFGGRQLAS